MQDQDYTVKDWKPWIDRETDELVTDPHGNIKGSLVLNGVGEPLDGTFTPKNQPQVGSTLYGHLEEYQTRAGKTRTKFKRESRQEAPQAASHGGYQPKDDLVIQAEWAIKQAREWVQYNEGRDTGDILTEAHVFFAMIEQVKSGSAKPTEAVKPDGWETARKILTKDKEPPEPGWD